jgi:colicin import membrane protein
VSRVRLPEGILAATATGLLLAALPAAAADEPCTEQQRAEYVDRLQRRINGNWRLPSHYREIDCTVVVVQSFRGEVLNATIEDCTDPEIRKTIENATYLSSPLPMPRNESCFQREISLRIVRKLD